MQVMWTTGPLGRLHSVVLRKRSIVVVLSAVAGALLVCGFAASLAAIRLAFDYHPALAATLGGVVTLSEAEQREAVYRTRLEALRNEIGALREQVGRLDTLKEEVAKVIAPARNRSSPAERRRTPGRGGPHIALDDNRAAAAEKGMAGELDSTGLEVEHLKADLDRMHDDWQREVMGLRRMPLVAPLADMSGLSSRYGARVDPFTHTLARHEGIDISAPAGTPILATASGVVARVVTDPQYGRMLDVDHGNGYMTRYAHALSIRVSAGDRIERGTVLGTVGSTGRSTAPHLHYEVRLHNHPQNPLDYGLRRN